MAEARPSLIVLTRHNLIGSADFGRDTRRQVRCRLKPLPRVIRIREVHLERLPSRPKDAKAVGGHTNTRVFYKAHAGSSTERGSEKKQEPVKRSSAVQPKKSCKVAVVEKQDQPREAENCNAGILRKAISEGTETAQRLTGTEAILRRKVITGQFNKTLKRDSFYRHLICAATLADRSILLGGH